ncbi:MAG: methylated-DNA--[protein]-cysteine S-methyltransferase [Deltaproteobacteria bacterium]|nr:methylated-DNA--[protein]-cysteine S-methyltransferase [Deltaproteobacteria bacterium]
MTLFWRRIDWTIGPILLFFDDGGRLVRVGLGWDDPPVGMAKGRMQTDAALRAFASYLHGQSLGVDVSCRLTVSAFARTVIESLRSIPYGTTVTYGQLASRIGRPGAGRSVGRALGANPCPIIFPCHRVVAAAGLGGFTPGLEWKRALLALEQGADLSLSQTILAGLTWTQRAGMSEEG